MTKKIIWADDHEEYRESILPIFKEVCKNANVEVEVDEVSDGKELVEKVSETRYDLIYTDNHMIKLDGLDAIPIIRKRDKNVPIYMLSNYEVNSEVHKRALDVGATGYICKLDDLALFKFNIKKTIKIHLK